MSDEKFKQEYIDYYRCFDREGVILSPRGRVAGLIGLGSELCVAPRDRLQLRMDMLDVQDDYWRRFGKFMDRMYVLSDDEPDGKHVKLRPGENPILGVRQLTGERWSKDLTYENTLIHTFKHSDFPDQTIHSTPWMSDIFVVAKTSNRLSFHTGTLQISDEGQGTRFDELRDCVLAWAKRLRPAHGVAGFTAVVINLSDEPFAYPTMQHYLGLDVHAPVSFIGRAKGVFNRIRCVNWLTVLGDEILKELGGIDAAAKALEPECTLHPYPGGLVIQAGPHPMLGAAPMNTGPMVPEIYRKVAHFTKPVRFMGYTSSLFRVEKPLVGKEEALKWVSRFD